jgi:hypothetical protein
MVLSLSVAAYGVMFASHPSEGCDVTCAASAFGCDGNCNRTGAFHNAVLFFAIQGLHLQLRTSLETESPDVRCAKAIG